MENHCFTGYEVIERFEGALNEYLDSSISGSLQTALPFILNEEILILYLKCTPKNDKREYFGIVSAGMTTEQAVIKIYLRSEKTEEPYGLYRFSNHHPIDFNGRKAYFPHWHIFTNGKKGKPHLFHHLTIRSAGPIALEQVKVILQNRFNEKNN